MKDARVDTVIRGGLVVNATHAAEVSVAIKGERIVLVGPDELMPPADNVIDARGKYVLPGAIDAHCHFENAEIVNIDDWTTGPMAAAYAGITTLIPFAHWNFAKTKSLPAAITDKLEEIVPQSVLDFGLHFILPNHPASLQGFTEAVGDAARMGVNSYKLFMAYKKRGIICRDDHIARVMESVAAHGGMVMLHCENGDALDYLEDKFLAEGNVHPRFFPSAVPPWTEEEAVNRAILLGEMTGCITYVVHLSTRGGLERIKEAQSAGQKVWTETCPQYLLLDADDAMERFGPYVKIGPSLRRAAEGHQDALWRGTAEGYVSAIVSDHSPKLPADREPGWTNIFLKPDGKPVPSGTPEIETLVPLVYSEGVIKRGYPLTWMARVLAENPARMFGLYPRKGVLQAGADADVLIMDPAARVTIRAADHRGKTGMTPFEGWDVQGRPWMTLLRGRVLLNQGTVEQKPGYGQFLPRGLPMPPIAGRVD
jgi:dihydropyrimidinase